MGATMKEGGDDAPLLTLHLEEGGEGTYGGHGNLMCILDFAFLEILLFCSTQPIDVVSVIRLAI